ncbi:amino acid ABC transporter permease [Pontivivens ytuae]|uniref:Amino acid ABC transporter permease n=1 Tax=Pontivivens ytuae TaxID=2789856 RepID=A0A7S9LNS3_9RHOB|nr:amino acid ABC transporter permease [Pontivivens ytuae]QPH52516.1 amino acid ABC transporter permease [Pontivivens ytuae]
MSDTHSESIAFVRHEQLPPAPPPAGKTGLVLWLRENLFSSWFNGLLSILSIYFIGLLIYDFYPWFADSVWNANSLRECREIGDGACFAVIRERWNQLLFGFYPREEYWRPVLAFVMLFGALAPVLFDKVPRKMLIFTALFPFIAYWLIWGGSVWGPVFAIAGFVLAGVVFQQVSRFSFPLAIGAAIVTIGIWSIYLLGPIAGFVNGIVPIELSEVASRNIGGFLLTVILGITAISASLPLGVLLALGRRSDLFIIKSLSVIFIEFIRGVPLITLLFVANVLLAYFLPPGTTFDLILRVVIMITLFASAYIAEVIRGGLAALPRGQYEAADSLGLDYWQAMRLIIMPQALKISIPSIVNVFIGLYKDTTLVAIISMFDMLGLSNAIRADADWNGIIWELYGFIALLFFISCYSMSQYSQYLERKLRTDHR